MVDFVLIANFVNQKWTQRSQRSTEGTEFFIAGDESTDLFYSHRIYALNIHPFFFS